MTLYLLVVTSDGEDSYSLWTTKQSAEIECRHLKDTAGLSLYEMSIIPIQVYD